MSNQHHQIKIKQPTRPLLHAVPVQLRFGDFDVFAHINNNVYFTFFDLGKAEYFDYLLGHRATTAVEIGCVVVNITTNFYAPTAPDEAIEVRTRCASVGDRSFVLEQQIINSRTGQVKCDAVTVMAGFDVDTQAGADIPAPLRAALEREAS